MANEGALRQRSNRRSDESNERPAQNVRSPSPALDGLRLVLLGKTSVGKSATGNSILGNRCFNDELSMSSVTKECKREYATMEGRNLLFFDSDQTLEAIHCCLSLCSPGPHAFLLVIPIERYTEEQQRTVEMILEMFHEDIDNHSILIFSHADRLRGESIESFVSRQNIKVQDLVERFGRHYVAFDNTNPTNPEQVSRLLQKVDELLLMNENHHFTNEVIDAMQEVQRIVEETMQAVIPEKMRKVKEEVGKMADVRWRALISDINEERQETERRKQSIQDRIDQIETDIMNEEQNVQPIPERLRQFRASLQEEQENMGRMEQRHMEKERERMKRKKKEKKDIKIWTQEEVKRKLSEGEQKSEQKNQHSSDDNKRIHWILGILLGLVVVFALGLLAFVLCSEENRTEQSKSETHPSSWLPNVF